VRELRQAGRISALIVSGGHLKGSFWKAMTSRRHSAGLASVSTAVHIGRVIADRGFTTPCACTRPVRSACQPLVR